MFEKIKMLLKIRSLANMATKEIQMGNEQKSGWRTTEFWLTLLANAPMIACTIKGHESLACLIAGALATISYHWQRGTIKQKALDVVKGLADEQPK